MALMYFSDGRGGLIPVQLQGNETDGYGFISRDGGAGLVSAGTDQRLTVDNTTGGVQFSAFPADTTHVLITSETAEIRYTLDGSAPTSSNGHVLAAGEERVWHATMAQAAKFIRTGSTSGVLHASPLKVA